MSISLSRKDQNDTPRRIRFASGGILTAAAALVLIAFLAGSYFTIAQYERGVVTRAGRLLYIAEPGMHFKLP